MTASVTGGRGAKVYRCKKSHGAGTCPAPASVGRSHLDELVTDEFLAHYGDVSVEGGQGTGDLGSARQELADAEAELAAYRDNTAIRDVLTAVGDGAYEDGLRARAAAVLAAREALEDARRTAGVAIDLVGVADVWDSLTIDEKRRLLTAGVDTVFLRRAAVPGRSRAGIDRERVRVLWRGTGPGDLPGPGRRNVALQPFEW